MTTGCENVAIGKSALGGADHTGRSNVAIGTNAMDALTSGFSNVAIGCDAMGGTSTGCYNIGIGRVSLGGASLTGTYNVAIGGYGTMDALTTGKCNVAIGTNALSASTTGCFNVGIGDSALGGADTTGANNIALGTCALDAVTSGADNIALGTGASCDQTVGNYNIAIGRKAMRYQHQGSLNIAIGVDAIGCCSASGNCNTSIGYLALGNNTSGSNNTMLGTQAGCNSELSVSSHSNYIGIGNQNAANFEVSATLTNPSDCRDKTDVTDLDLGLDYIKALRPVYYRWDKRSWYDAFADGIDTDEDRNLYINYETDGSKKRHRWELGLLAQEALTAEKAQTDKEQCRNEDCDLEADEGLLVSGTDSAGYRMGYTKLIMPLINAVQELDAENTALKARVATLEG